MCIYDVKNLFTEATNVDVRLGARGSDMSVIHKFFFVFCFFEIKSVTSKSRPAKPAWPGSWGPFQLCCLSVSLSVVSPWAKKELAVGPLAAH